MLLSLSVTGSLGSELRLIVVTQALRQHAAESDIAITAAVLGTLSRAASACARLHLRDEILASPDVVLSILLLEESFQHQVMRRACLQCSHAHLALDLH